MMDVHDGQVALLFLTAGALFHERGWALWFSQAAELLPLDSLLLDASVSSGAATGERCIYRDVRCACASFSKDIEAALQK